MDLHGIVRRSAAALALGAMLAAPTVTWGSGSPAPLRSDAFAATPRSPDSDLLLGSGATPPDAALRPSDERDPSAPLAGTGVLALLLAAATLGRFLGGARGGRERQAKWTSVHAPRAPPLLLTI